MGWSSFVSTLAPVAGAAAGAAGYGNAANWINVAGKAAAAYDTYQTDRDTQGAVSGTLGQQRDLLTALATPNNPKYKALYAEELDRVQKQAALSANQFLLADRRDRLRGGRGFINPERRDEALAQALMKARIGAGQVAARNTMARLTGGLSQYQGLAGALAGQGQLENKNRADTVEIMRQLGAAIGGAYTGQKTQENITWKDNANTGAFTGSYGTDYEGWLS